MFAGAIRMHKELTADNFASFFRAVHDQDPFPWQHRLTRQVIASEEWPEVIDLPTGTGKTAILDTAIFALAVKPETFPRRIVFVIDRRIIVDQVCERARRIRDRIRTGESDILQQVRARLGALSDNAPLGVAALRGGVPVENEWTHRPDQPWVVVSTVDQFGSRLLFRGYGVNARMYPVQAGLAGNDCLVILDEVHLSVPFAETLEGVSALSSRELPRRFQTVEMSATPHSANSERFTLNDQDWSCPELRRRVGARKKAALVSVQSHDRIPATVLRLVKSIAMKQNTDKIHSVGIVVNRVHTARETHRALQESGFQAHLLTGRMRPLDRLRTLEAIMPVVDPDRTDTPSKLTAVVATQAIEVGADFNFETLITECAPIDSLRQRFGRLDRRGTLYENTGRPAPSWILGVKGVVQSEKPDPIYGLSVKAAWQELERLANGREVEIGHQDLRDFPQEAFAPRSHAPLLLKTHMDAWCQTNPQPLVQPTVDQFLHGMDQKLAADVSVVWRRDRSQEALQLVPPRQAEYMQIPIDAARAWLASGTKERKEVEVADVAVSQIQPFYNTGTPSETTNWVRWAGFGKKPEKIGLDKIRPGDILLVDPKKGGMQAGTWDPTSDEPVEDLGDWAQVHYGRRVTMRLDSELAYIADPPMPDSETAIDISPQEQIKDWIAEQLAKLTSGDDWFTHALQKLQQGFVISTVDFAGRQYRSYFILSQRISSGNRAAAIVDAAVMDGSDEAGSFLGTQATLTCHLQGVGQRAHKVAKRLGLSPQIASDLRLAGSLHDIGKVDPRFQEQLVGGDPVVLEMLEEALAKSLPGVKRVWRYPRGMRHELASVGLLNSNPDVLCDAFDRDLVLHLIGTHHGWARPLPPIIKDRTPQTLSYTFHGHGLTTSSHLAEGTLALDMADRFWRLVQKYGYYGLAWLEAILRLADHRQSESEAEQA